MIKQVEGVKELVIWQWCKGYVHVYSEEHNFVRQMAGWDGAYLLSEYFFHGIKVASGVVIPHKRLKRVLRYAKERGYQGNALPFLASGATIQLFTAPVTDESRS